MTGSDKFILMLVMHYPSVKDHQWISGDEVHVLHTALACEAQQNQGARRSDVTWSQSFHAKHSRSHTPGDVIYWGNTSTAKRLMLKSVPKTAKYYKNIVYILCRI